MHLLHRELQLKKDAGAPSTSSSLSSTFSTATIATAAPVTVRCHHHLLYDEDPRGVMGSIGRKGETCIPVATLRLMAVALALSITAWTFLLSTGGRHCGDELRRRTNTAYEMGWDQRRSEAAEGERGVPFVGRVRLEPRISQAVTEGFPGESIRKIKGDGKMEERGREMESDHGQQGEKQVVERITGAQSSSTVNSRLHSRLTLRQQEQQGSPQEGPGERRGGGREGKSNSSSSAFSPSSLWSSSAGRSADLTNDNDVASWQVATLHPPTYISNIVFGIAAAASFWDERKEYVKLWWKPEYRGFVWFEEPVIRGRDERYTYPQFRISEDITNFLYTNTNGVPAGIRLTRIVSETFRMGLRDVHWFVLGDDDTVFSAENLAAVLSKYDHREMYYIGSNSESHTQNVDFSYIMAFGGGGVAVSYALAEALVNTQDGCIGRYPELYGSDDRLQACAAELGVPLTKEAGFHQMDIYGNAFGLLSAHPVAPFISLHHVGLINPLIPGVSKMEGLKRMTMGLHVDPGSFLQQTIYINKKKKFSLSVTWSYCVQFFPSVMRVRELERPELTFDSWHHSRIRYEFPFNIRLMDSSVCKQPTIFFVRSVRYNEAGELVSVYERDTSSDDKKSRAWCRSSIVPKEEVKEVVVVKEPVDWRWYKSPRRMCCKSVDVNGSGGSATIRIARCSDGEVIA